MNKNLLKEDPRLKERYYYVSYAHENGFGSISFTNSGDLLLFDAKKQIDKQEGLNSIILYFVEITKTQYDEYNLS